MSRFVVSVVVALLVASAAPCAAAAVQAPAGQGGTVPVDQSEGGGAAGTAPIRIGGATLTGSVWLEGTKVTREFYDDPPDPFRLRRARVGVAGSLTSRIGWTVTGEFSGQPELRNAFVVIRLANQVSVRVGQANPIASLERGSSPLRLELIDRSIVTSELTGPPDIGLTIHNPDPYKGWLGYALNVTNGSGFNRLDDNDAKDVSGRIALSPPMLSGLTVVVSGARGEQPLGLRTRSGVGIEYRRQGWRLMAERLRQVRDRLPASDGYFVMAAYRHRPRAAPSRLSMFEFAGRVSVLHDHATAAGVPSGVVDEDGARPASAEAGVATSREVQLGVNYYVRPNLRVMGDVVVPVDDRQSPGPSVLMRLQFLF